MAPRPLQLVLVCGGRGTRLNHGRPHLPKALTNIGGRSLVSHLIDSIGHFHTAAAPVVCIVAEEDDLTPRVVVELLGSGVTVVRQAVPDGVANAILLAMPHLHADALVCLGDIVVQGTFSPPPPSHSAVCIWKEPSSGAVSQNFGINVVDGVVTQLVEKPGDPAGFLCGVGIYVLARQLISEFAHVPVNPLKGEREITEALRFALGRGHTLLTFEFSGSYVNVNRSIDVVTAEEILKPR